MEGMAAGVTSFNREKMLNYLLHELGLKIDRQYEFFFEKGGSIISTPENAIDFLENEFKKRPDDGFEVFPYIS